MADPQPWDPQPWQVARVDQTKAKYDDLINHLASILEAFEDEVKAGGDVNQVGPAANRVAWTKYRGVLAEHEDFDFVMYLIGVMLRTGRWVAQVQLLAEPVLQAAAWMLPADHPAKTLVPQESDEQIAQMAQHLLDEILDKQDSHTAGERFVTGTGQTLNNVHPASDCDGDFCVIHKPCPGPWDQWPTHWRGDDAFGIWRGFERICPHGVPHTAVEEVLRGNFRTHGCDGCPCGPPNSSISLIEETDAPEPAPPATGS